MSDIFETKIRRVGTSLGVLIPKEVIEKEKIREGEKVRIGLLKEKRLELIEKAFGIAKGAGHFEREQHDRTG